MVTLNEKIGNILKRHPEGKEFFDALDYTIRSDRNILQEFVDFVWKIVFAGQDIRAEYNLILSGRFGNALATNFGSNIFWNFSRVVLTNGNLRNGELPVIYLSEINDKPFVFLDDSFYSGKTRDVLEKALQEINPNSKIIKTIVVYDGSLEPRENVYSMYRYHKK
jgi:hypothetical protein